MENKTFLDPAVADLLENNYVEARLHADYPRFLELENSLLGTVQQPAYAVVSTDQADLLNQFQSDDFDGSQVQIKARWTEVNITKLHEFTDMLEAGRK